MVPTSLRPTTLSPTTIAPTFFYPESRKLKGTDDLYKIVDNEINRLDGRNKTKEIITNGKSRITQLNDSYRKKYLEYIKIVGVISLGLFFVWLFRVVENIGFIPGYIVDILLIIVISVTMIIAYLIYIDILKHDRLNFDELELEPPEKKPIKIEPTVLPTTPIPSSNATPQSCPSKSNNCGTGTVYDSVSGKCVSGAYSAYNSLSMV